MNKKDIIRAIVDKHTDFTQKEVGMIIDEFLDVIQGEISKGQKVSLAKFGNFEVVQRAAREGRNPQTGEVMMIAASKSPKFKPAKAFKDFVNA
ncbi:HU family DNA-binding protein [Faecalicatena contorta]|uniref:HU family DNA-binding protein n=1 Tax=Faecalicatena contorta TaxID=39482 RepID=UPI00195FED28|nr:HU family DNA-binding protein [Faecalicatena contorta]MBM6685390.1 HU family DNA-binding protein [Faecalicatena contorta]MBM6710131.1 HU family DNA-binding protein [Faecalicatena contorta]